MKKGKKLAGFALSALLAVNTLSGCGSADAVSDTAGEIDWVSENSQNTGTEDAVSDMEYAGTASMCGEEFFICVKDTGLLGVISECGHGDVRQTEFHFGSMPDADSYRIEIQADNMKVLSQKEMDCTEEEPFTVEYCVEGEGAASLEIIMYVYRNGDIIGQDNCFVYAYGTAKTDYYDFNTANNAERAYVEEMYESGEMKTTEYIEKIRSFGHDVPDEIHEKAFREQLQENYGLTDEECQRVIDGDMEPLEGLWPQGRSGFSTKSGKNITIEGSIQWKYMGYDAQPAKNIRMTVYLIQMLPDESVGLQASQSVETDGDGNFSAEFGVYEGLHCYAYLKAEAAGSNVSVKEDGIWGNVYAICSEKERIDISSEEYRLEAMQIILDENTDNAGRAFFIQQSAAMASKFVHRITGEYPDDIDVYYPVGDGSSFYQEKIIHIALNRWDCWDVIQHEYGHYIDEMNGITLRQGGKHVFDQNMIDYQFGINNSGDNDEDNEDSSNDRRDPTPEELSKAKRKSIGMCWSEAVATYLMTMVQEYMSGEYARPVHDKYGEVNDGYYLNWYSTESGIRYNRAGIYNFGEASEVAIGGFLYNITDEYKKTDLTIDGREYDFVSLEFDAVWELLTQQTYGEFSEFNKALCEQYGLDFQMKQNFGKLLTYYAFSSAPDIILENQYTLGEDAAKNSTARTFSWQPEDGSTYAPNDIFEVTFYDSSGSVLDGLDEQLTENKFTVSMKQWSHMLAYVDGGEMYWQVSAFNSTEPETGPYLSEMGIIDTSNIRYGLDAPGNLSTKGNTTLYYNMPHLSWNLGNCETNYET